MPTRSSKPGPATKAEHKPFPGVDPTAPGGMSQANLRIELAEYHGIPMNESRDMAWTAMISAVVDGRLRYEATYGRGTPLRSWWYLDPEDGSIEQAKTRGPNHAPVAYASERQARQAGEGLGWDYSDWPEPSSEGEGQHHVGDGQVIDLADLYDPEEMGEMTAVFTEVSEDSDSDLDLDDDEDDSDLSAIDAMLDEADPQPEPGSVRAVDDILAEDTDPAPTPEVADAIARAEQAVLAAAAHAEAQADDVEAWFDDVVTERDEFVAAMPPSLFLGMPGVLDYTFSGHAGTGPSQADRWMKCTASLGMSRRFLENLSNNQQAEFAEANIAARQGTTAHSAAEVEARVMLGEMTPAEAEHHLFELAINPPAGEDYTPEMAVFITEYTDLIKQYIDAGHEVQIEARLLAAIPLTAPLPKEAWLDPEDSETGNYYVIPGSGDAVVYPTPSEMVLTIVDLKYGEGKDVDPVENPQGMTYGLGALAECVERGIDLDDITRVDIIIAQPRLGGIKSWSTTVDALLTWRDEVLSPALTAALGLLPSEFAPAEDTCQWCAARGNCQALAAARTEAAAELFEALDDAEFGDGPGVVPSDLDDNRLGSLLAQIGGLIDLHSDLKAEAQRRMYRGAQVPGYVLVNYQPSRHWVEGASEELADQPLLWTEPQLRSPTQAIEALAPEMQGKTIKARKEAAAATLADLVVVPEKRPIVAPESSNKSRWHGVAPDQMFTDMDEEE